MKRLNGIKFFSFLLAVVSVPLLIANPASAAYYLLVEPQSSVANQSTNNRNIDLNFKLFTGTPSSLFHTYYVCPVISNDSGDLDLLQNRCQSIYVDGFNSYSSYSNTISTGATLLYPGANTVGCMVLSSKDNFTDYQYCEDFGDTLRINYTGEIFPIYRFWSNQKQHHFYTIESAEKTAIQNKFSKETWQYEAIAYSAIKYRSGCSAGTPIYRFWSDFNQGHFFTINAAERDQIIQKWPDIWKYEGIAFCANTIPSGDLSTPVYRFWSPQLRGHFYTTSIEERDQVIQKWPSTWQYEGIAYYVN